MENTNLIKNKDRNLIFGLVCVLLVAQNYSVLYASQPLPDNFKVSEYFSFFGSGGIDWQALHDPNNNPILLACIKGVTDESLETLGIPDVQQRLERLERGNLIKKVDGRYKLTFPAVVGDKRDKLREYAKRAAQQLVPSAEKTIAQIQLNLSGHDEMLYHILWSVVMDGGQAWDAARAEMNKKIDVGDTSTENKAWLIYPSHPFQAGTNSWNRPSGHLKVTWSRNTPSPNTIGRLVSQHASQLIQAIEQDRTVESADAKNDLSKYGLLDEEGKVRLYIIKSDSEAAKSYAELGGQFGRQIMDQLDVKKVAEMLDVSPGVAFVIAYHEICWQLLQDLAEKKTLEVPQIVAQAGTKASDEYRLVSLTTIKSTKDPLLDTEVSAEESQAIEEFRRIKSQILAGESYKDTSTPLHAVLTHLSELGPGQTKDYFIGLDIFRAPAPPAKPQEASLWPVFAGDTELADTLVLVYSKGQWIWIGNMGGNYDWNIGKSTFEKWAREKIEQESSTEEEQSESKKTELNQKENEIAEYFEKTKNEILQGRKFRSQSTPADALLTLISAYHHQDRKTLEQIFPIVRQKQFERLSSPEVGAQMLAAVRKAIICRIEIENESPKESDLCAIYSSQSPDKTIDQVWSFAYVKGAWRFAGSTSESDNWRAQAKQAEAMTRNILQSQAENTKAAATNTPQQNVSKIVSKIEGKWQATLPEFNQNYEIRFWRKPDGTLAGAATRNSPDDRPFDEVTFENSKLRFEEKVNQGVFEGTMKEDGLTIEGNWQKPDLITPCVLERIENFEIEDKDQGVSKQVQGVPKPDESTVNRVLSLDGKTGCMRVADSQSLRSFSDAITIEVWLKASSFNSESGNINSVIRKNITPRAENFLLRFRNIDRAPMLDTGFGSEVGGLRVDHEFVVGKWYHLAGTYDGSTIAIFVDGLFVDSKNISGRLNIDQSDLYIGRGNPTFSSGEYFHGELDEIRIWNVARSQEQIQAAINSPLTGREEGLVGYWNFEDGTAKDLSSNGNDGVLDGNAEIVESSRITSVTAQNMLLARWKLDEAGGNDVADSSGNACGGKLIGNPQWRPTGGKVGGAIEFDGEGDCVQIDDESAFDIAGPITIAAWFKVNTFDKRWQSLVTKGDTSWRLQRYAEDNTLAFHCTGITSVTSERPEGIEGKKNVNDRQWHHVVGVYDGSEILLYIDGVLDNSSKASGEISMNDWAVIIGGNSERSGREWSGLIDEVDIIAGAIDANAVHALYAGADPNMIAQKAISQLQSSDKLIAWWKFEDNVNDSAGTNNGIIQGNPTYVNGKIGRAIGLDGDDYVDLGNPDSLNFGMDDWTISAWIKTTQTGANQDDALMNRGTVFANGGDEAGGIRYALAINEGQLGCITLTTDNDYYKVQAIGKIAVNDGVWHHVVGMRKSGQLYLYIDGVLDGGDYLSAGYDLSGSSQHNAYIGVTTDNRDGSLYKYYVGLIDEVCIFAGAIDAKGVVALYSGENPVTVAKTMLIRPKAQPQPTSSSNAGAVGGIEGDWQLSTNPAIIQIRRKSDGSLEATAVAESPDTASPAIPLDDVTFENGTLRFKATSQQAVFEGTMNEDGMTIEGQIQQQGQVTQAILKRIVAAPSASVPIVQEQLQDSASGKSNIVVALILVLVLAGVVGGIVYFLVKSSIR
jgi:anthranilate/para-aminobenzoate synthase component I